MPCDILWNSSCIEFAVSVSINDFAYAKVFQSKCIKMLLNVINQIMIYYSKMISDFCKGIDDESGIDKRKMWR